MTVITTTIIIIQFQPSNASTVIRPQGLRPQPQARMRPPVPAVQGGIQNLLPASQNQQEQIPLQPQQVQAQVSGPQLVALPPPQPTMQPEQQSHLPGQNQQQIQQQSPLDCENVVVSSADFHPNVTYCDPNDKFKLISLTSLTSSDQ